MQWTKIDNELAKKHPLYGVKGWLLFVAILLSLNVFVSVLLGSRSVQTLLIAYLVYGIFKKRPTINLEALVILPGLSMLGFMMIYFMQNSFSIYISDAYSNDVITWMWIIFIVRDIPLTIYFYHSDRVAVTTRSELWGTDKYLTKIQHERQFDSESQIAKSTNYSSTQSEADMWNDLSNTITRKGKNGEVSPTEPHSSDPTTEDWERLSRAVVDQIPDDCRRLSLMLNDKDGIIARTVSELNQENPQAAQIFLKYLDIERSLSRIELLKIEAISSVNKQQKSNDQEGSPKNIHKIPQNLDRLSFDLSSQSKWETYRKYDRDVAATMDELGQYGNEATEFFRNAFIQTFDKSNLLELKKLAIQHAEQKNIFFSNTNIQSGFVQIRELGPSAIAEYKRVHEILGDDMDVSFVVRTIKGKI